MVVLDTTFSEQEKKVLFESAVMYGGEIKVFYIVDEKKLFCEGVIEGEKRRFLINSPHRMIEIGGLYLLEEKDNVGIWSMGDINQEKEYVFWGEYGELDNAVRSL